LAVAEITKFTAQGQEFATRAQAEVAEFRALATTALASHAGVSSIPDFLDDVEAAGVAGVKLAEYLLAIEVAAAKIAAE